MRRLLRRKLVVGGVVLLAAGCAGGAYAATHSSSNSRQALLNDVAKRLNVSPSQLRSAIQGAMLDRLQAAVKAGQLTQAEANRIKQRIEQGGFPFGPPGPGGEFWGPGHGPGLPGRGIGPPAGAPGGPHGPLDTAATYLGLSESKLIADLQSGKTLAQVAQAQGKSVSGLEQALIATAKARLDRLVRAGWMSKASEQARLSRLSARIDEFVTHGRKQAPPSGGPNTDVAPPPAPGPGPFGSPPAGV
jgi:hypothetical protein